MKRRQNERCKQETQKQRQLEKEMHGDDYYMLLFECNPFVHAIYFIMRFFIRSLHFFICYRELNNIEKKRFSGIVFCLNLFYSCWKKVKLSIFDHPQ